MGGKEPASERSEGLVPTNIKMRGKYLVAVLLVFAATATTYKAYSFIVRKYSLEEIIAESTNIVFGTVSSVNKVRKWAIVDLEEDIKGKSKFDKIKINIAVGQTKQGSTPTMLMKKFNADLPFILFYRMGRGNIDALGHISGTWFQMKTPDNPDKDKLWWNFTHIEIHMPQTYKGSTPNFQRLLRQKILEQNLAAKAKVKAHKKIKRVAPDVSIADNKKLEESGAKKGMSKDKMVLIPAGEFSMGVYHHEIGDSDAKPVHTVYLDAFYIDKYVVTNAQYAAFLNKHGKNTDLKGKVLLDTHKKNCLIKKVGRTYKPKAGYENHPAIEVSWYGAMEYAKFYGKRLPTEAEWEKAARGGLVGKKYPRGNDITHDDANYSSIGGKDKWEGTSPVGSFAPNGYGLYDMAGNVYNWCSDWYSSNYYTNSPNNNPQGPSGGTYRVLRGGSRGSNANDLRCAYRNFNWPQHTYVPLKLVGFRCVRDVIP